jgi:transcriptional regulator of acetoin/glycerol metabolism
MLPYGTTSTDPFLEPGEYQRAMQVAWNNFTDNQQLDAIVPPFVATSWRRCWGRVNPTSKIEFTNMSSDYVLASQTASFDLIAVARPVMEDVYQCVKNSGTVLVLTNNVGCVLDLLGDEEVLSIMKGWNAGVGSILSEELIGTSSFGLAITERMPVQVAGHEHFMRQFHIATGTAAPIFDMTGHLLGVLGQVMPINRYHIHSLGLVVGAARAIESQHQADVLMAEQTSQLAQLNAIISAISDGIMVWSAAYKLVHANNTAGEMLGIPAQSMMGHQIDTLFTPPGFLLKAVLRRKPLTDVEGVITIGERTVNCLISLNFVYQNKDQDQLQWIIVTLRSEKKVRMLVHRQVGSNATLTIDDIPGEAPQMQRVRSFVRSAAGAQASILIRGEVGTGKNVLASAVHNASPRKKNPFVVFACSSIPNELVVSELLGNDDSGDQKGITGRPSKFELAQGGTLFFQDVDILPLEAQIVLLNALELGVIQRMGSRRAIEVDARVVASTSVNMENLISQGTFRPDLYYRLSTFMITLPPLRERARDIPLVVDRILTRLSSQIGYSLTIDDEVIDVFKKFSWPGNIREVEAVLGRAAMQVAATGGRIEIAHIPGYVRNAHLVEPGVNLNSSVNSLDDMERETILRVAHSCRGNVTRMAEVLGIGRTTLWRKLKTFSIDPVEYRRQ